MIVRLAVVAVVATVGAVAVHDPSRAQPVAPAELVEQGRVDEARARTVDAIPCELRRASLAPIWLRAGRREVVVYPAVYLPDRIHAGWQPP